MSIHTTQHIPTCTQNLKRQITVSIRSIGLKHFHRFIWSRGQMMNDHQAGARLTWYNKVTVHLIYSQKWVALSKALTISSRQCCSLSCKYRPSPTGVWSCCSLPRTGWKSQRSCALEAGGAAGWACSRKRYRSSQPRWWVYWASYLFPHWKREREIETNICVEG